MKRNDNFSGSQDVLGKIAPSAEGGFEKTEENGTATYPEGLTPELPGYDRWLPNAWDAYMHELVGPERNQYWGVLPATFRWSDLWEGHLRPSILAAMKPVDPDLVLAREILAERHQAGALDLITGAGVMAKHGAACKAILAGEFDTHGQLLQIKAVIKRTRDTITKACDA